jgi:hypothetical protein
VGKPEILLTQAQIEVAIDNKLVGFIRMEAIDFLRLTLDARDDDSPEGFVHALQDLQGVAKTLEQYNAWSAEGKIRVAPGLAVVPGGHVVGHEGRHRAAALIKEAGEDSVMLVGIELRKDDGSTWSPRAMRNPARLRNVPPVLHGQWLLNRDVAVPVSLEGAIDLYEGREAREAPRKGKPTRADCSRIQQWLYDYLSTDVDPYDFNFAVKDWIEQEGITDGGTPYVDPTDVMVDDLSPEQLKAFTAWLKKSGELDMYRREMPYESPAYLTLQAESKLPEGSWLVHFTSASFTRFERGTTLEGLHLSTWNTNKAVADCSKNLQDQGAFDTVFGFAFDVDRLRTMGHVMAASRRYGSRALIFQTDCAVEAYHDGDEEHQAIFPLCSEYNVHELTIDSSEGIGVDDGKGDGNLVWFGRLDELAQYLESRPRPRARRAGEATRQRAGESSTGFYHASWDELAVGTVLEGRRQIDAPIERLFEELRRSSQPNHAQAVFMVRDPDAIEQAGGGIGGFVYEVEPVGAVSGPYDGKWYGEIAQLHMTRYRTQQDLTKYGPTVRAALQYWDGVECPDRHYPGVWEYLATGARVVRRVR